MKSTMKSSTDIKADYVRYLAKGMELLHSKETRNSILSILKGKNPVQLIANATILVMQKIDNAARKTGMEVQDTAKLFAAHEFVTQLCEIAEAAKLFTLGKDYQELALSVAVQDYVKREIAAGRIDPIRIRAQVEKGMRQLPTEQRKEVVQSMEKIKQTALRYQGK